MEIKYSPDYLEQDMYVGEISRLINISRKIDSSVIPHSEDELIYRYRQSLICINWNNVIWHIALYSTEISEIISLNIWEIWSVIVDPNYRLKGIWSKIILEWILKLWTDFSAIVAPSINPIMIKKLQKEWFIQIPFPKTCLEWWKKYLAPLMEWWEKEFLSKAKFSVKENNPWIRDKILSLIW